MLQRRQLTAGEMRDDLRSVLDAAMAGEIFEVGARRRPEAVVIGAKQFDRAVPPEPVMASLLAFAAIASADLYLRDPGPSSTRGPFHPGDDFGRIVAWLWLTDQTNRVTTLVVDLVSQLRHHHPKSAETRIPLEEILGGLGFALPFDFPDTRRTALLQHLRTEVPRYFGQPLAEGTAP